MRPKIDAGRFYTPWWRRGPLIDEDANCVAHVYWRSATLLDSKGNSWTTNGTVPQVGSSGLIPPGAGPFTDANYYSLGAGNDVLDFAGDFTLCVVYLPASTAGLRAIVTDGAYQTAGWQMYQATAGTTSYTALSAAATSSDQNLGTTVAGQPSVSCLGRASTTMMAKVNLGATATSAAAAITAATTQAAYIGRAVAANQYFTGTILEVYASTTTPSNALFTSIQRQVFSRLRRAL